jgi:hypothetical protein
VTEIPASEPEFLEYRQGRAFAHFAGFSTGAVNMTGSGDPLCVAAAWGTSDFFQILGTNPLLGRVFTSDEFQPGHNQVAVLSYGLWMHLRWRTHQRISPESYVAATATAVLF